MCLYKIDNCMGVIANKIITWKNKGVFNDKKVLLYGLDAYSYGMHSVLLNHGIYAEGYLCEDMELCIKNQRAMKGFASRFMADKKALVGIWSIEERLSEHNNDIVILIASRGVECIIDKLAEYGYLEGKQVFTAIDWRCDEFSDFVEGRRRMKSDEIKEILKEMLNVFDTYCREKGISYWVCGGTLLGTIRHRGFIPWDDDIDVLMKWDDYLKFMRCFPDGKRYTVVGMEKTKRSECFLPFGKLLDKGTVAREEASFLRIICPISLDVFPLVGVPGEEAARKKYFSHYKELLNEAWEDYYANDADLTAHDRIYPKQRAFFTNYDVNKSSCVGVLGTAYWERDYSRREVYETTIRMPFEDIEVNVPGGYEEYLVNLYGENWMILPPESERKSHHFTDAYFIH